MPVEPATDAAAGWPTTRPIEPARRPSRAARRADRVRCEIRRRPPPARRSRRDRGSLAGIPRRRRLTRHSDRGRATWPGLSERARLLRESMPPHERGQRWAMPRPGPAELAAVLVSRGALDEAASSWRRGPEHAPPEDVLAQILWRWALAQLAARTEDDGWRRGRPTRRKSCRRRPTSPAHRGWLLLDLAGMESRRGDATRARARMAEALALFEAKGHTTGRAPHKRHVAHVAGPIGEKAPFRGPLVSRTGIEHLGPVPPPPAGQRSSESRIHLALCCMAHLLSGAPRSEGSPTTPQQAANG